MTKETILEEMERCLIPLSLMNNREHQEFIKSALMGNLSKLADKLVKECDSLPCVRGCFSPDEVIEILEDATSLEDAKVIVNEGFANEG